MKNIRIGLLVDDMVLPAWIARALELILLEQGLDVAVIIKNASPRRGSGTGGGRQLRRTYSPLGYRLWKKLDTKLFKNQRDAFRLVDMAPAFPAVPVLELAVQKVEQFDDFSAEDIQRIAAYQLDVLVQFGFGALRGEILHATPAGVWACQYALRNEMDDYVAGAWEVLTGRPTTRSALTVLADSEGDVLVLQQSWSATDSISMSRTAGAVYWKTASFIPRKLTELRDEGVANFLAKHVQSGRDATSQPDHLPSRIGNTTVFTRLVALFGKKLHDKVVDKLYWKQWILLYHFGEAGPYPVNASAFKQLMPPSDRFWADPFVVQHEGRYSIFIEELEYSDNRGYLSVINFDEQHNPVLPPVPILKKPYHLSYPHVFEDKGTMYMVPESSQNRTIELYRAVRYPDQWEFVLNLMEDVSAVDTTIWFHDKKYWMFTNITQTPGASSCDELFLFYSEDLLSNVWHRHPVNPIVSDVRRARQAGRIFQWGDHWYRPSQDCSGSYGKAIQIQRIDLINEMYYRETPVGRLDPDWDADIVCTHTLTHMGGLTCIDGMKVRKKTYSVQDAARQLMVQWLGHRRPNLPETAAGDRMG